MNAAMEGSIEQAEQLLQEGADLEERDDFGWTPLPSAVNGRAWVKSESPLRRILGSIFTACEWSEYPLGQAAFR